MVDWEKVARDLNREVLKLNADIERLRKRIAELEEIQRLNFLLNDKGE